MKIFGRLSCLVALASSLTSLALCQTTNGTIGGTVTDPSGGAVGGVQVNISSKDTGFQRSTTTQENGGYTLPQLPPGTYDLSIQKAGFASESRPGVQLLVS